MDSSLFALLELPGESAVDDPVLWEIQTSWEIRERAMTSHGFRATSWVVPWARQVGLLRERFRKEGPP